MSKLKSAKQQNIILEYDDDEEERKRRIWMGQCRYDVVGRVALESNFRMVAENENWHLSWSDSPLPPEKIVELRRMQTTNQPGDSFPIQKLNHFPGMYEICRKDRLGRNLNRLKRIYPQEYNFFPSTWDLPSDMGDLLEYGKRHRNATYIVKPDSGSQGKGIFLVKNLKLLCPFAKCVCQIYLPHPFLVDGYKFDQRIYVLLTCVDPLRVYIYREGIARFATVKYQVPCDANLDITYMHLTNYSLNKFSDSYDPEGCGSKRPLTQVYQWMTDHGYDVQKLQDDIDDVVIKTIICVAPTLRHNYRTSFPRREKGCMCFEILGFDILIDNKMKPILVEVNHSPSFNLDTDVDHVVKYPLIRDIFAMMYFVDKSASGRLWKKDKLNKTKLNIPRRPGTAFSSGISDILKDQFAHEEKYRGDFRLIFREETPGRFAPFMDKEYHNVVIDEPISFKRRPEATGSYSIQNASPHDSWNNSQKSQGIIRRTQNGDLYVETVHGSNPVPISNTQDYLKFKFNSEMTNPNNTSNKKSTKARKSKSTKKNLFEKKHVDIPDINNNNNRNGEDCTLSDAEETEFPACHRVKVALDKLRKKNFEKIQKFTDKNTELLKKYGFLAFDNDMRPKYTQNFFQLEEEKRKAIQSLQRPNPNILQLDMSKLPSIFQQVNTAQGFFRDFDHNGNIRSGHLKSRKKGFNNKPSKFNHVESFKPQPLDIKEETKRMRTLNSRKTAIKILGIEEKARQIIEITDQKA